MAAPMDRPRGIGAGAAIHSGCSREPPKRGGSGTTPRLVISDVSVSTGLARRRASRAVCCLTMAGAHPAASSRLIVSISARRCSFPARVCAAT